MEGGIRCETATRLPLTATKHILNSMRYIFLSFINGSLFFLSRTDSTQKIKTFLIPFQSTFSWRVIAFITLHLCYNNFSVVRD